MTNDDVEFDSSAQRIPVPLDLSNMVQVLEFCLTFNAYDRVGDLGVIADIARAVIEKSRAGALTEVSVDDLRTSLFFLQRRARHTGEDLEGREVIPLLEALFAMTGGYVDGPGDPLP